MTFWHKQASSLCWRFAVDLGDKAQRAPHFNWRITTARPATPLDGNLLFTVDCIILLRTVFGWRSLRFPVYVQPVSALILLKCDRKVRGQLNLFRFILILFFTAFFINHRHRVPG